MAHKYMRDKFSSNEGFAHRRSAFVEFTARAKLSGHHERVLKTPSVISISYQPSHTISTRVQ